MEEIYSMKVILLQDVKALGKKGEVVECNDGYARNCIIKKNLGIEATAKALNDLKLKKANEDKLAQQKYEEACLLKNQIEKIVLKLKLKVGDGDRAFGSISAKEISEALKKEFNFDIDKKKVELENPIRALGKFDVVLKLHTKVTAELRVEVDK